MAQLKTDSTVGGSSILTAASGLNASNLSSGTVAAARISNTLTPDKAFRRGNILGTVSQSGGVPTGAIIERGSNANGEFVKYADGTMICFASLDMTFVNTARYNRSFNFPATFIGNNLVVAATLDYDSVLTQGFQKVGAITARSLSVTGVNMQLFSINNTFTDVGLMKVYVNAIGRWY